ncbi:GL19989 [Drosophila persimilis]|uniref:GL19989 n=1 Tax=Drosophila persimilis TaxID=7234 RepID=B4HD77_DROPE|nr:alsin homolog [Drosophila persimilis]XP_026845348.1 alsin homolog [Drosophila persimilis]EDW37859.1 GL19989 [Drosophila persimilis]
MCSAANDKAMKVAVTPGDDESFIIYHDGTPPLTRPPALRICRIGDADRGGVLLLTTDHSLYSAQLQTNRSSLDLTLLRSDVVDVDYCSGSLELFVVLANGSVQRQFITCLGLDRYVHHPHAWQTLSFDPVEIIDEGVRIRRVCCSAQGVVFVSANGETYVMGSCGEVFKAKLQPRHMRLYEEGKELLDLAAGNEHFVMLVAPYNLADDVLQFPLTIARRSPIPAGQNRTPCKIRT